MSLLIKNGEVITASERYVAGIFCENETITQIDRKIDNVQADEVVDATGKYVFLGMERAGRATCTADEGMITRLPLGNRRDTVARRFICRAICLTRAKFSHGNHSYHPPPQKAAGGA